MSGAADIAAGGDLVAALPAQALLLALLLLPICGAASLLALAGLPRLRARDRVRKLALALFVVEAALAGALVVGWLAQASSEASIETTRGTTLAMNLHLRLDGVAVPFLILGAIGFPLALSGRWPRDGEVGRAAGLLVLQAAVVAVILAADLLFFCAAWLAMVAISILIAGPPLQGRHALVALGSAALLGWGTLRLAVAFHEASEGTWEFEFEGLSHLVLPRKRAIEGGACVLIAALVQLGLVPLHGWTEKVASTAETPVAIALLSVTRSLGLLLLVRLGLPLYASGLASAETIVGVVVCATIVLGALLCVSERSPGRLVAGLGLVGVGVATLGVFSATAGGILGASLWMLGYGVALAGLLLAVGAARRAGVSSFDELRGLRIGASSFVRRLLVCALAAVGFPGSLAFVGLLAVLVALLTRGASDGGPAIAWVGVVLTGVVVAGIGALRTFVRTAAGRRSAKTAIEPFRERGLLAAMALVIALCLAGGLWSGRLTVALARDHEALAEQAWLGRCHADRLETDRPLVVRWVAACDRSGEEAP